VTSDVGAGELRLLEIEVAATAARAAPRAAHGRKVIDVREELALLDQRVEDERKRREETEHRLGGLRKHEAECAAESDAMEDDLEKLTPL
jgi:hypothetical protein